MHLRIALHALDRTGPPSLARSFVAWLREHRPELEIDVVAFRGGPLVSDFGSEVEVEVLLEPSEAWDHRDPDPHRLEELRGRARGFVPADATLLISVAAGQMLPILEPTEPITTWVVEVDEDLHWLTADLGIAELTRRWMVGTDAIAAALLGHLGDADLRDADIVRMPEFVPDPKIERDAVSVAEARRALGVDEGTLLVVGAGIATPRKAPDLFVEVAVAAIRHGTGDGGGDRDGVPPIAFRWIGGADDEMFRPLQHEVSRLGLDGSIGLLPPVADLDALLIGADAFLHPARTDAFPLVCLQAAALGIPVLGFGGRSGQEDMFGAAAQVAPYPDVNGLSEMVIDLLDPERGRAVGAEQRTRVLECHTASAVAERLVLLLDLDAGSGRVTES